MREDYGMEDELNSQEEPFGATFSRLMDINCTISVEEEQSQASTLLEAACSERIQPFDDSESDEEDSNAWETDQKITFVSPMDQQSVSSDKDEDFDHHPRELQTGSSNEEGEGPSKRAAHYLPTAPNSLAAITSTAKGSEGDSMMEIDSAFGGYAGHGYLLQSSTLQTLRRGHCWRHTSGEFKAYGAMNLVRAFFSSFTAAGSLSHSNIPANSGGKTQPHLISWCPQPSFLSCLSFPFEPLPK